jgi:putative DNA primase/helicase
VEAGIRQVKAFIEQHGASRFADFKPDFKRSDDEPSRIFNRAGFRHGNNTEGYTYLVLPEAFKEQVCGGFDHRPLVKALTEQNHMQCDSNRLTKKVRLPDLGNTNVYMILPSLFDEPEEKAELPE